MADASNTRSGAALLRLNSQFRVVARESIGGADTDDYFRFRLRGRSSVDLKLSGLTANADVQILNRLGNVVATSANVGARDENINRTFITTGDFFVRVFPRNSQVQTNYTLSMSVNPDNAGNSLAQARPIELGPNFVRFNDYVGTSDRNDYYKFTLSERSSIDLSLINLVDNANVTILNRLGSVVGISGKSGTADEAINRTFNKGIYYIRVFTPNAQARTTYSLRVAANPDLAGDTQTQARQIELGAEPATYNDFVGKSDRNDFYSFTINPGEGKVVNLGLDGMTSNASLELRDGDGRRLQLSNNPGKQAEFISEILEGGTYYVRVFSVGDARTQYTLNVSGVDIPDRGGNTPGEATPISRIVTLQPRRFNDYVGDSDPNDYYRFSLTNAADFDLSLSGLSDDADVRLFRFLSGNIEDEIAFSNNPGITDEAISLELQAGSYYIQVSQAGPGKNTTYEMRVQALPFDGAPNTPNLARDITDDLLLSGLNSPIRFTDFVGSGVDENDYFTFTLQNQSFFSLDLKDMTGNADVELLRLDGSIIETSARAGTASESIRGIFDAGTYLLRVYPGADGVSTFYNLDVLAASTSDVPAFVRDLRPGPDSANPQNFTSVGGDLVFVANDGNGFALWKSNGTYESTVKIASFSAASSVADISNFTVIDGTLYFTAPTAETGIELWKSNLIPNDPNGTTLVKDIWSGSTSSSPSNLINVGNQLYFTARSEDVVGIDFELWTSDGTADGTRRVADLEPGLVGSFPTKLTNLNGTLYFTATTEANGEELYRLSESGDPQLLSINLGSADATPANLTLAGTSLYFTANDGTGNAIWQVTNDVVDPVKVTNLPAAASSLSNLVNFGDSLYFTANGGDGTGTQLWRLDDSPLGAIKVTDISPTQGVGLSPQTLTVVGNLLYFTADDGETGRELWKYDGSSTSIVKDILDSGSSNPLNLVGAAGVLYFTADNGVNGRELWRSIDGTNAELVYDINEGSDSSTPSNLTNIGERLFFTADDGVNGSELWVLGVDVNQV